MSMQAPAVPPYKKSNQCRTNGPRRLTLVVAHCAEQRSGQCSRHKPKEIREHHASDESCGYRGLNCGCMNPRAIQKHHWDEVECPAYQRADYRKLTGSSKNHATHGEYATTPNYIVNRPRPAQQVGVLLNAKLGRGAKQVALNARGSVGGSVML